MSPRLSSGQTNPAKHKTQRIKQKPGEPAGAKEAGHHRPLHVRHPPPPHPRLHTQVALLGMETHISRVFVFLCGCSKSHRVGLGLSLCVVHLHIVVG